MRTICVRLRQLREEAGMTVGEISEKAGCSASVIKSIEDNSCDMSRLKLGTAAALANALNKTIDEVFTADVGEMLARKVYRICTTGFVRISAAGKLIPEKGMTASCEGDILCANDKTYDDLDMAKSALSEMPTEILGPFTVRGKNKRVYEVKEYFIETVTIDSFGKETIEGERIYSIYK